MIGNFNGGNPSQHQSHQRQLFDGGGDDNIYLNSYSSRSHHGKVLMFSEQTSPNSNMMALRLHLRPIDACFKHFGLRGFLQTPRTSTPHLSVATTRYTQRQFNCQ